MSAMLFVGMWLATYRVTRFILDDTILERPRNAFYRRFPPDAKYAFERSGDYTKISKLGELMFCFWCIGFWISGAAVAIGMQYVSVPLPVMWWLAISSAVGLTARNLDGE